MDCHSPTVLSLCTGAGGLELGLKLAIPGSRTVCYVEGEAYAASILAARMEDKTLDAAPVWSDVRTFDSKPWRGCVDIITAGYPCQPFSIAGRKQAEQDPRHLWPYIRDIVADLRPRIAFFENVAHHLRLGFEQVDDDLRGMGYSVKTGLFTAEEVGASHKRERLFILAYRQGVFCERCFSEGSTEQFKMSVGGQHSNVADPTGAGTRNDQFNACERFSRNCKSVADAFEPGLERFTRYEETGDGTNFACGNCLPAWPPAPRDTATWESVPIALKPAVHRMADGMADRVDRIRLCGNGVVPLAAAYAFRTLASFIEG